MSLCAAFDAQSQTQYPRPVSEYAEETGPGTMVFLSYPKYYKNTDNQLTAVNPNLVPSADPAWDYEVSAGIWQLKVRKDGTFQASHAGDSFTYRFHSLGFGRGSAYQKVDLGEPDFSHVSVTGDTVRWSEVYPDVDVSVRYIHDILKVDVKLKKAFMADLKAEVKAGRVNKDDYLTARFDIPQVMVRSTAKQNGKDKDLYAESVDVDAPIFFEKDGKELYKLRPVETYLLDEKGELVIDPERPVRSKQTWQLKKNAPGAAEMSANVGDLADLPEGDVVIDPAMVFYYSNNSTKDTSLRYSTPDTTYGTNTSLPFTVSGNKTNSDQLLFGFGVQALPAGVIIQSASLRLCLGYFYGSATAARVYMRQEIWSNITATWNNSNGHFNTSGLYGNALSVNNTGWFNFDATAPLKAHLVNSPTNAFNNGFVLKYDQDNSLVAYINSREASNYRPELHIKYGFTQFGADTGGVEDTIPGYTPPEKAQNSQYDGLNIVRIHSPGDATVHRIARALTDRGMKMILVITAKVYSTQQDYVSAVTTMLGYLSNDPNNPSGITNHISYGTVVGIELGNEEEGYTKWLIEANGDHFQAGRGFAEYYLAAFDTIKNNANHPEWRNLEIISGGSVWDHGRLTTPNTNEQWTKLFIQGFVDRVTANGDLSRVPDTMAIHTYIPYLPPEGYIPSVSGDLKDASTIIYKICKTKGFVPNFAITEYSYSAMPSYGSVLSEGVPTNRGDCYTQAVYYLRSKLFHGSNMTSGSDDQGNPIPPIGWKYSLYYHHVRDTFIYWHDNRFKLNDHGFFNPDAYPGTSRAVRDVNRILVSAGNILQFGHSDSQCWIPFTVLDGTLDKIAYCGWKRADGIRWLAVWRFKYGDNQFYEPNPSTVYLTIDGDYSTNSLTMTQFTISQSDPIPLQVGGDVTSTMLYYTGSATLSTPVSDPFLVKVPVAGGKTQFTIPLVDENPRFVRIQ